MKFRKTPLNQRNTYKYSYQDSEGHKQIMELKPGENGVTEADIKSLHAADDAEVYNNIKNCRPPMTDTEKVAKAKWKKKKDANDETAGDEPVKNWHLSIDYYADSDDDSSDKLKFLEDTSFSFGDDVSPEVEHLHEIIDTMTARQQEVYKLLFIEECSLTETAEILGMSVPTVYNHKKRILEIIKKNF